MISISPSSSINYNITYADVGGAVTGSFAGSDLDAAERGKSAKEAANKQLEKKEFEKKEQWTKESREAYTKEAEVKQQKTEVANNNQREAERKKTEQTTTDDSNKKSLQQQYELHQRHFTGGKHTSLDDFKTTIKSLADKAIHQIVGDNHVVYKSAAHKFSMKISKEAHGKYVEWLES